MKIIGVNLLSFLLYFAYPSNAQNLIDTLHYKNVGVISDTFYLTKEHIKGGQYKITSYYGLHDNSNISLIVDTFLIANDKWEKVYNNEVYPFLSIQDFMSGKSTFEWIDKTKKELFYRKYTPIKKVSVDNIDFYIYLVVPMSGKGMVESLGDLTHYIVFNFNEGLIYDIHNQRKILEGYERYLQHFKW